MYCKIFVLLKVSHTHKNKLEIGLLYDLPIAKTVSAEPISPDDWEILVGYNDFLVEYLNNFLSFLGTAC